MKAYCIITMFNAVMILTAISLHISDWWAERQCRSLHDVVACQRIQGGWEPVLE